MEDHSPKYNSNFRRIREGNPSELVVVKSGDIFDSIQLKNDQSVIENKL